MKLPNQLHRSEEHELNHLITSGEALDLLRRASCSLLVIKHCKAVSKLAVKVARELRGKGVKVDLELVRVGGLLHDIGRSKTHGIDHAVVGAEIARSFNLPPAIVRIVERHMGSGIPAEEAASLGLPERDFTPETLEEKIVTYSDKLIENNHEISFDEALKRFSDEFGESHAIVNRFKRIHSELGFGA